MGNYTRAYNPQPTQRVGSAELKAEFQAIENAFTTEATEAERTLRQSGGSAVNALPNAASRALKVLSFDASGHPITSIATVDLAAAVTAATTATTQAGIATTQAGIATTGAGTATTQAGIATTQAGIATSAASTATTQAGIATTGGSTATTQAGIATTQAGIATTQAGNASTSASSASGSASSASSSATSASGSATSASGSASTATTQAGIATTQAGIATTKAAEAAASAASIAGGPVASVNGRTGVVTGVQDTLVSGTSVKTVNSTTLLGSGDLEVGYRNVPQNSQSAAYTCVLGDSGKHILHPSADTTARVFTIPANASVAYPIGTAITFVNQASAGVVTIAITTDTMRVAGNGTTGSRTLAANGIATAVKLTATEWIISGTGLT